MSASQPGRHRRIRRLPRRRRRCAGATAGGCGHPARTARPRARRGAARGGHRRRRRRVRGAAGRRHPADRPHRRRCRQRPRRGAAAPSRAAPTATAASILEHIGREPDGPRAVAVASGRPIAHHLLRRIRMMAAVARQGFDLCGARERPTQAADASTERPLEPLLPGFVCASAAMHRVVDQIQRLQGNDLTVLITGESGTGKELVARAIHVGSPRSAAVFLPYNCTTTTRELADSQLFGHRRGAFTGAVSDQPGLVRTADRRDAVPRRSRRPAARRAAQAAALSRTGRDHAGRRNAAAARRRARHHRDQRRSRTAGGRGQVPRRPVLPLERDPHPRAAAAAAARGDPAPEHVFPARGVRAARQARRAAQLGGARPVRRSTGGRATSVSCATRYSARSPWRRPAA